MSKASRTVVLCALMVCVPAAWASADVVVLKSGARITGKARVLADGVRIETQDGTLTLSSPLVARVVTGARPEPTGQSCVGLSKARSVRTAAPSTTPRRPVSRPTSSTPASRPAAPERKNRTPLRTRSSVPSARQVLETVVSVDFDGVRMQEAISYLQELTGGNFSYKLSELEAVPHPVTVHLKNMTVRQVLDVLVEGADLLWYARGGIIRIRRGIPASRVEARVYDVGDLRWSQEDHVGRRARSPRERRGGRGAYDRAPRQSRRRDSRNRTYRTGGTR